MMKKYVLLIAKFFIFSFLPLSCVPNFLKNNDSIPNGYEKINFSPKNDPSEMIRDSLDKSISTLLSLNNIFPNYSSNIIQQMNMFLNDNQNLNSILNENIFSSVVNNLPPFPDPTSLAKAINSLDNSSFILTATPSNTINQNIQSDKNNIFTKIIGKTIQSNSLNEIQFMDNNGNIINNKNINANYKINTYYVKNFFPSWVSPLNNTNNTWEMMVQCVSAKINMVEDSNSYDIAPWPRITILHLNPNSTISDKYILVKNNIIYNTINQSSFIPIGNITQRTQRIYNASTNGLAPQSLLFNSLSQIQNPSIPLTGESYVYFQDGMTSFFSRFLAASLTPKVILNNFTSWQISVNKSWFDITRKLDSSNNIPQYIGKIPANYLNNQNIPVNSSYSSDYQLGGIHYIDQTDTKELLLQVPNNLDATSIGLDESSLKNICLNIIN